MPAPNRLLGRVSEVYWILIEEARSQLHRATATLTPSRTGKGGEFPAYFVQGGSGPDPSVWRYEAAKRRHLRRMAAGRLVGISHSGYAYAYVDGDVC